MSEIATKMRQLLTLLASFPGGKTCYEDYPDSKLAPFWDDNGTQADTFNQAIDQGLILATVDSDTDSGFAAITEAGRAVLSAIQNPQAVSSDGREIWDWASRLSEHVARQDKIRTLRQQIAAVGLACGDCDNWMKSRQCPKEWNDNGRQRGPSMASPRCAQFVLDRFASKLRDERQAELAALSADTGSREG